MKKSMIIFLICVTSLAAYSQEWITVNEPFSESSFMDLFFIDAQKGWIAGTDGKIFYTSDGGVNWSTQTTGTEKDITKIFFLDENIGWAGTGNNLLGTTGGSVLRTTDGGMNWTEVSYTYVNPTVGFTYCDGLLFTDVNNGFIIAGKTRANYIIKTTDGGLTWAIKDSLIATTNLRWYDIAFNGQKGIVGGNKKDIQKYTTDGGENWISSAPVNDAFFKDIRTLHWLSDTDIIALGEGNEFQGVPLPVYRSTDAGLTWIKKTQSPVNSYERVRDLLFFNSLEGLAVGSNGFSLPFLYRTSDGGETWTPSAAPYGFSLRSISGNNDMIYCLGTSNHIIKSSDKGLTWEMINVKPTSGIYGIRFINGKGFSVTRNGEILTSADDTGELWSLTSSTKLWETTSFYFLNENTGFILKENRYILKTTDGGLNWTSVLDPVPFNARNKTGGIHFPDNNTGYAWMSINQYEEYYVYKTTDGGESWNQIADFAGPGSLSGDIKFFDANTGFMAGTGGWLKYTTDGGAVWNDAVINNLPSEYMKKDFEAAVLINENTAWVTGYGKLLKTTNKGASWEYVNHNLTLSDSSFYAAAFFEGNLGYAATFNGIIIKTTDGGVSWEQDTTFFNEHIFFSAAFNANGEVFLGTSNGTIIKYKKELVSVDEESLNPSGYELYQNYPNPFNPSTVIKFSLEKKGFVELTVFDMLGREVSSLINNTLDSGDHAVSFDASGLTSGIYLYKIKTEGYSSSKKMLLIK